MGENACFATNITVIHYSTFKLTGLEQIPKKKNKNPHKAPNYSRVCYTNHLPTNGCSCVRQMASPRATAAFILPFHCATAAAYLDYPTEEAANMTNV